MSTTASVRSSLLLFFLIGSTLAQAQLSWPQGWGEKEVFEGLGMVLPDSIERFDDPNGYSFRAEYPQAALSISINVQPEGSTMSRYQDSLMTSVVYDAYEGSVDQYYSYQHKRKADTILNGYYVRMLDYYNKDSLSGICLDGAVVLICSSKDFVTSFYFHYSNRTSARNYIDGMLSSVHWPGKPQYSKGSFQNLIIRISVVMIVVLLLLGAGLLIFLIKRSERKMAEEQTTSQ